MVNLLWGVEGGSRGPGRLLVAWVSQVGGGDLRREGPPEEGRLLRGGGAAQALLVLGFFTQAVELLRLNLLQRTGLGQKGRKSVSEGGRSSEGKREGNWT
jgi:hypothetical protein